MKRVLLTGGSGFIGRHTLPFFINAGYEVYALVLPDEIPPPAPSSVNWIRCNLFNHNEVEDIIRDTHPDHLLHLAWNVEPGKYVNSPDNLAWVQCSLELFQQFANLGGRRIVAAGTCFEYDCRYGFCNENLTPACPVTLYGACKNSIRVIMEKFSRISGVSFGWGRIFYLYGPYEHPARVVPHVVRSLLRREPVNCSHGRQIRDFMYVEDVASAFVSLLDSKVEGAVNIASGRPVMLKDIFLTIAEITEGKDFIKLGAIAAASDEPAMIAADTARLNNEVGWQPSVDLASGLKKTVDWWKCQM